MIRDRVDFALQFPVDWPKPQFKLGELVGDGEDVGLIVGAEFRSEQSLNSDELENYGWWFYVCCPFVLSDGRVVKNIFGKHESVIQRISDRVEDVSQRIHEGNTTVYGSISTFGAVA